MPNAKHVHEVVKRRGTVHGSDPRHHRAGGGIAEIVQKGKQILLRLRNLKVENNHDVNLYIFLSKTAVSASVPTIEKEGLRVRLRGGKRKGAYKGNAVVGLPVIDVELSKDNPEVEGIEDDPSIYIGFCVVKPRSEKPSTPEPLVYVYANLEIVKHDYSQFRQAISERKRRDSTIVSKMMEQKRDTGLSLKEIKRKAKACFEYFRLNVIEDDVDLEKFKDMMEYLGYFLTDVAALRLFNACDLDKGGSIDFVEFQICIHMNDMIKPRLQMTPNDAFEIFDTDRSGFIDELEFYEAMVALGVEISEDDSSKLFATIDEDKTGTISSEEFEQAWIQTCNVREELEMRDIKPKFTIFSDQVNRDLLLEIVKREEAEIKEEFAVSLSKATGMRQQARHKKEEKKAKRRRQKHMEERRANKEKTRRDKEMRQQLRREKREQAKRERIEAELSKKISTQHEERKGIEKREMQDRIEQAREEERKEVERKGEDLIDMSFQQLKKIPDIMYRSINAQQQLGKVILLDLSHNNILELPKSYPGMLFHLSAVRKLDLSHNKLQQIPGEIESLGNLEIFDLYGNALVELPPQIGKLGSLKVLNLGSNALTDLPREFDGLTSLTYLSMERNRIESLTPGVLNLPALKTLNLGLNELRFLPRDMAGLKSLACLNVTMNKVERIPNSFGKMENLQKVVLAGCQIKELTASLISLRLLQSLDLKRNLLSWLPPEISGMEQLLVLDLSHNRMRRIPDEIGNLKSLEELYLPDNKLTRIPKTIGNLESLRKLDLRLNGVASLPPEFGALKSLQYLDISYNKLSGTLLPELGTISNLRCLRCSHNEIEKIPATFGALDKVRLVDFSNNRITSCPLTIGGMERLESLNLASNRLQEFPYRINECQCLRVLDFSSNLFTYAPATIADIPSLRSLSFFHNRLRSIPVNYAPMIKRLKKFDIGRNPFDDLPRKWSDKWETEDKYKTALSGYTEKQVIDYTMDTHKWYDAASKEWRTSGHKHFAGERRLEDFMDKIRTELGDSWIERLRPQIERFYIKAMQEGQEPRHDQLLPDEAAHRKRKAINALNMREQQVKESRKMLAKEEQRVSDNYAFMVQDVLKKGAKLERAKAERDQRLKEEERRLLREVCEIHAVQQGARERERKEAELQELRSYLENFRRAREEFKNSLPEPAVLPALQRPSSSSDLPTIQEAEQTGRGGRRRKRRPRWGTSQQRGTFFGARQAPGTR